jgi:hypothetical protein
MGGYTGDFPQTGPLPVVRGAKLAAVRPNQAKIAVWGLPQAGAAAQGSPIREARAIRKPPSLSAQTSSEFWNSLR